MRIWAILVMVAILSTSVTALSPAPEVDCCYDFIGSGTVNEYCTEYIEEPKREFCLDVLSGWNLTIKAFAMSEVKCCYDRLELGDRIDPGCGILLGDFSYCAQLIAQNEALEIDYIEDELISDAAFYTIAAIIIAIPIILIALIIAVIWLAVKNHKLKNKKPSKKRKK